MNFQPIQRQPAVPLRAQAQAQAPAQNGPRYSFPKSKAGRRWNELCRAEGYCQYKVDPNTGKGKLLNVPKKGTPEYTALNAKWQAIKRVGY